MSWEINTTEWHYINNVNENTKIEVKRLVDYIQQINHMDNMESFYISYLKLMVDDKEVVIENENSWEPVTGYVASQKGMEVDQAEHLQWEESSELIKLLEIAPFSTTIKMDLCYSAMLLSGKKYGYSYWVDDNLENEAKSGNVKRKIIEYYDTDESVTVFELNENGSVTPEYNNKRIKTDDVESWFCYTPELHISDEEQMENAEMHDTIMKSLKQLCTEYFGLDEDELEDKLEDDWEDFGEILINGSLSFKGESITEIVGILKALFEQIRQSETMEIKLIICAVPEGEDDYKFASVAITYDGTDVKDEYCMF